MPRTKPGPRGRVGAKSAAAGKTGRRVRSWPRRLGRWLLLAVALWLVLTSSIVLLFRFVNPPTTSFMVQHWFQARSEEQAAPGPRQQWRPLEQIAPALRLAVVASEDQKFPVHRGFDVDALRQVARQHLAGEGGRGGSTISQQTAKNLFLSPSRSWMRKGVEAYFTVLIETLWPKRRVLEVYLNIAEFGPGIYGAEVAARRHFGTTAAQLGEHEAALLAAVLPSPRRYRLDPPGDHVRQRAAWIRGQMRALGGPSYLAPINADQ